MPTKEATVPWFTIESDGAKWQWKLWGPGGKKLCEAKQFASVADANESISQVKRSAGSPVEFPGLVPQALVLDEGPPPEE